MSINQLFWTWILWGWWPILESSLDDITINWFWIQNSNIHTRVFSYDNMVDLQSYNLPKRNWRGLLWYYQRGKKISLEITIKWSDQEDFFNKIDELRKYIFQEEIYLSWKVNGKYRKIKVNCIQNGIKLEHYNITFLKTTLDFETLEPYFYLEAYQSSQISWVSADVTQSISNQWTAPSDIIIYLLFWTWLSWVDTISIESWENTIAINETISDGDIIIINWEEKTVKLNDVSIDYDGVFPSIWVNTSFINFSINWTFSANIITLNKINYV